VKLDIAKITKKKKKWKNTSNSFNFSQIWSLRRISVTSKEASPSACLNGGLDNLGIKLPIILLQIFAFRVMEKEKIMKYNVVAATTSGIKCVDKIVAATTGAGGVNIIDKIENDENHESVEVMTNSMSNSITKLKVPKITFYGCSSPLHRSNKIKVLAKKTFIESTYSLKNEPGSIHLNECPPLLIGRCGVFSPLAD
jgi:hypothetical protein